MENQFDDDEIQIDLGEILFVLSKRIWVLILAAVIGFGIFAGYSKFILTPQYTSTSMVYILSKETTLTSLADLQIGSQLTKDYRVIVSSRPVLQDVIEHMGLDMTYRELGKKLTVENPSDTRILSLSVVDPDPARAKAIVDEVAKTASSYIGDIMEMVPPKIIETGEVPTMKTTPHTGRNAVIGGMLGIMIVCGLTVLQVILNDSIRSEEDVEKYLELSVLASLPDREENQKREEKKHNSKNPLHSLTSKKKS